MAGCAVEEGLNTRPQQRTGLMHVSRALAKAELLQHKPLQNMTFWPSILAHTGHQSYGKGRRDWFSHLCRSVPS